MISYWMRNRIDSPYSIDIGYLIKTNTRPCVLLINILQGLWKSCLYVSAWYYEPKEAQLLIIKIMIEL